MMWPKGPYWWDDGDVVCVSIPFTWNLPAVRAALCQSDLWRKSALVGGPAVELQPDYFGDLDFVTVGHDMPGVLRRINPLATRTTLGCPNQCQFCAVPSIEGGLHEFDDWDDLPVICDNNLLAASVVHLDKVFDRLEKHTGVDFNQGLDFRRLTDYHIERFLRLKAPRIRLACDTMAELPHWLGAFDRLRSAGVPRSWINTYALIGWSDSAAHDWDRCEELDKHCRVYPMWFHPLDAMEHNGITNTQIALGWCPAARKGIMVYYYKHRGKVNEGLLT
jgi:hypothetical protein